MDVYLANPSVGMSLLADLKKLTPVITYAKADFPNGTGVSLTKSEKYHLPAASTNPLDADKPDQPGHRCILARVYPTGSAVPTVTLTVPTEQHEAQLNIGIAKLASFGARFGGVGGGLVGTARGAAIGPDQAGLSNFLINTTATHAQDGPEIVTLVATAATQLPPALPGAVLSALREIGFTGKVTPARVVAMNFDLAQELLPHDEWKLQDGELVPVPLPRPWKPKLYDARQTKVSPSVLERIIDWLPRILAKLLRPLLRPKTPRFTVRAELLPRRVARFALQADMRGTRPGDAQVFRIEQTNAAGESTGGYTLIMVRES